MTNSELDAAVLEIVAAWNGRAHCRWVEVQLWSRYSPETIHKAPDTFDVRDAVWRLVESGKLNMGDYYRLSVVG